MWGVEPLTEERIRGAGFSTPWDAPLVPPFPMRFRGVEVLTLYWREESAGARVEGT